MSKNLPTTHIKIDHAAIRHNIRVLRKYAQKNCGTSDLMVVIKANAYGHGLKGVTKILQKEKVGYFAVSDVAEGVELRRYTKKPILLFESLFPADAQKIIDYRLTPTISHMALAKELNRRARKKRKTVRVHIEVDTGMGRLGIPLADAKKFIQRVNQLSNIKIEGVFTHFPSADSDKKFTRKQIQKFSKLLKDLQKVKIKIPIVHVANSPASFIYKTKICNMIRPGLSVYGLYPEKISSQIKLKPAMSVKSKVILLKNIEKGEGVSYGRTFRAKRKMRIAVIPIGYSDGYLRALSNKSSVLISETRCRVLGRVTMDQIMVDVTRIKNVRIGSPVVVLGKQKKQSISAEELAGLAKTINYEITCAFGNALK